MAEGPDFSPRTALAGLLGRIQCRYDPEYTSPLGIAPPSTFREEVIVIEMQDPS